jgi:hypothetical protein
MKRRMLHFKCEAKRRGPTRAASSLCFAILRREAVEEHAVWLFPTGAVP